VKTAATGQETPQGKIEKKRGGTSNEGKRLLAILEKKIKPAPTRKIE